MYYKNHHLLQIADTAIIQVDDTFKNFNFSDLYVKLLSYGLLKRRML